MARPWTLTGRPVPLRSSRPQTTPVSDTTPQRYLSGDRSSGERTWVVGPIRRPSVSVPDSGVRTPVPHGGLRRRTTLRSRLPSNKRQYDHRHQTRVKKVFSFDSESVPVTLRRSYVSDARHGNVSTGRIPDKGLWGGRPVGSFLRRPLDRRTRTGERCVTGRGSRSGG